jgi:two-component system, NarL family, response regulator NreC
MTLRVLLVDDHQIVREGLRALLDGEPDIEVVGEAQDGRTALQIARGLRPDVVVMDIAMKDLNGIDATRSLVAAIPGVRVIGLSMHSDRSFVARMLQAGAAGYLIKDSAFDELARAVRAVATGGTYLSPAIAAVIADGYVRGIPRGEPDSAPQLSLREREVLQLIAEGNATRVIAELLHVSAKTIETHRLNIMRKLKVNSVAALTKTAIRLGLTTVED